MSAKSITIDVPNHIHKYVIGTKGATIKSIQQASGDANLKVTCSGDQVVISSTNDKALVIAKQQIEQIHNEHKDKVDLNKMTQSKQYTIPKNIQKYIIGDGGAGIKQIQQSTQSQFTFTDNNLVIKSSSDANVNKAFELALAELRKYGWFFDEKKGTFFERNFTDQVFGKYRTKATQAHELMAKCYDDAQKAFTAGKKDEAKKLSEEGKKHQADRDKYQNEAAQAIFNEMNKDLKEDVIDLHGLFVAEAVKFVETRLEKLIKEKKIKTFYVITGAGNHSAESAKIKPEISKLLENRKLKFTKGNEGTFTVSL